MNWDDNTRTALVAFLNGLVPFLAAVGILHLDAMQLGQLSLVVGLATTFAFRLFKSGQGA